MRMPHLAIYTGYINERYATRALFIYIHRRNHNKQNVSKKVSKILVAIFETFIESTFSDM